MSMIEIIFQNSKTELLSTMLSLGQRTIELLFHRIGHSAFDETSSHDQFRSCLEISSDGFLSIQIRESEQR